MSGGVQRPVWREGLQRHVTIENPPAGSEFIVRVSQVPEGVFWRLKALRATFTGSAVAGTRDTRFAIGPNETDIAVEFSAGGASAPGLPLTHIAHEAAVDVNGLQFTSSSHVSNVPFDLRIPSGWIIRSHTVIAPNAPMDVGDQWSGISLWVQELIYVPPVDYISGVPDALKALHDSQLRVEKAILAMATVFGGSPT